MYHAQTIRQHDNTLRNPKSSQSNNFPHITQCSNHTSLQTMSVRVRKAKHKWRKANKVNRMHAHTTSDGKEYN